VHGTVRPHFCQIDPVRCQHKCFKIIFIKKLREEKLKNKGEIESQLLVQTVLTIIFTHLSYHIRNHECRLFFLIIFMIYNITFSWILIYRLVIVQLLLLELLLRHYVDDTPFHEYEFLLLVLR
jgi:hypothetical protein